MASLKAGKGIHLVIVLAICLARATVLAAEQAQDIPNLIEFGVALTIKPVDSETSPAGENPQWFLFDLGGAHQIDKVMIKWGVPFALSYKIAVSEDRNSWKEVYSTEDGRGKTETASFPSSNVRYVRIDLKKTENGKPGFRIIELSAYGKKKLILF